jgi:hypothetical protein
MTRKIPGQRLRAERTRYAKRTRYRPAKLRSLEAPQAGMQVRAPAGQSRERIGDNLIPGRHDAKQLGLDRTFPAPYAGAHRCRSAHACRGRTAICH